MTQLEIDQQYIKSITSLHTSETFIRQEPLIIQLALEEAIRTKTGKSVDFTSLIAPSIKQKADELKNIANAAALALIEETKTASSSDNELELDLLKEDLMCIICKAMDVGARNRLLECVGCHSLYHQECHRPIVSQEDADQDWLCQSCKDLRKAEKIAVPATAPISKIMAVQSNIIEASSYKSNILKSGKRPTSPVKPTMSKVPNVSSNLSSTSRSSAAPNINIISAEKKIQIMKKKALAKQHEKRKLPR